MLSCLTANCYWFVNTFKKTNDPNFFQILVLLPILYVIDLFYQQKQKPKYRMSNMDKVDLKKKATLQSLIFKTNRRKCLDYKKSKTQVFL